MERSQRVSATTNDVDAHKDGRMQGGFNRSSQHLDLQVCVWDAQDGGRRRQEGR
jgi:hypothetical protein